MQFNLKLSDAYDSQSDFEFVHSTAIYIQKSKIKFHLEEGKSLNTIRGLEKKTSCAANSKKYIKTVLFWNKILKK